MHCMCLGRLHLQRCCMPACVVSNALMCVLQDSIYSLDRAPDREVVHSHDWNRYITPFRAEWDPKDEQERLMVIGR